MHGNCVLLRIFLLLIGRWMMPEARVYFQEASGASPVWPNRWIPLVQIVKQNPNPLIHK